MMEIHWKACKGTSLKTSPTHESHGHYLIDMLFDITGQYYTIHRPHMIEAITVIGCIKDWQIGEKGRIILPLFSIDQMSDMCS